MNVIDKEIDCSGCGACVHICPTKCLKLKKNNIGFYNPDLKNDLCVNCSKCLSVCPTLNNDKNISVQRKSYYGWTKDENIRFSSTSGGVFYCLYDSFKNENGVIFGAKYSDDFKCVEYCDTNNCSIDSLMKSKYCQSYPGNTFEKIEEYLKKSQKVLIVGTPCFISACRNVFGNNDNLYLVDFICGGFNSARFLSEYVNYLERKYKSKVTDINMRDKTKGWGKLFVKIGFENNKTYFSDAKFDEFLYYFYKSYFKNDLCLKCPFVEHNASDLTIGDFWGYKKAGIENDEKGMSLICSNTDKGEELISKIKDNMIIFDIDNKFSAYAFKEKSYSDEKLSVIKKYKNEIKNTDYIEFSKSHEFRLGKFGLLLKLLLSKIGG